MTREIAHFQMFGAALDTIKPNFPPGILQGDPRHTHTYFNMSNGADARGPWNEGQGPWPAGEEWVYVDEPMQHVVETEGERKLEPQGTEKTEAEVKKLEAKLSKLRSGEVKEASPKGVQQWSAYPQEQLEAPGT